MSPRQKSDPSEFTRLLSKARHDAGLSQAEVAAQLDWSKDKVLKVENEKVPVSMTGLNALLDLYGIKGTATGQRLHDLARAKRNQRKA